MAHIIQMIPANTIHIENILEMVVPDEIGGAIGTVGVVGVVGVV